MVDVEMPRATIALVAPPFAIVSTPSLALGLLKGNLREQGFSCTVMYSNVRYAELINESLYTSISSHFPVQTLIGDWLFSESAFGTQFYKSNIDRFFSAIRPHVELDDHDFDILKQSLFDAQSKVAPFVASESERIAELGPDIVGFTTTFQQTVASIALSKAVRRHIAPITIIGGANCQKGMGAALWKSEPAFDYVCLGEGEQAITDLAVLVAEGKMNSEIDGCVGPRGTSGEAGTEKFQAIDLAVMAEPDFDDYFDEVRHSPLPISPSLVYETSRGCWWGQKNHCIFCGLSQEMLEWRQKDDDNAIAGLSALKEKYGRLPVVMSDLIMPYQFLRDGFLNKLKQENFPSVFYETKSNLTKEQVRGLSEAKITQVQPGIESFSTPVLRLMRKGVTGLNNIAFLKWARTYGITPTWNFLWGFPGEKDEWYQPILEQTDRLFHLYPPMGSGNIGLDRDSPLFKDGSLGGLNGGPFETYQYVYPWPEATLSKFAYFFQMGSSLETLSDGMRFAFQKIFQDWRSVWHQSNPILTGFLNGRRAWITDHRMPNGRTAPDILSPEETTVLLALEAPQSFGQVTRALQDIMDETAVKESIKALDRKKLIFIEGDQAIGLPIFPELATPHQPDHRSSEEGVEKIVEKSNA